MAELWSDNQPVMDALLRALSDPGSVTPRAPRETLVSWQRRAVVESAVPLVAGSVGETCALLAESEAAKLRAGDSPEWMAPAAGALEDFAALLREDT